MHVIELYEYAYFIFRLVVSILVSLLTLAYGFISKLLPGKRPSFVNKVSLYWITKSIIKFHITRYSKRYGNNLVIPQKIPAQPSKPELYTLKVSFILDVSPRILTPLTSRLSSVVFPELTSNLAFRVCGSLKGCKIACVLIPGYISRSRIGSSEDWLQRHTNINE